MHEWLNKVMTERVKVGNDKKNYSVITKTFMEKKWKKFIENATQCRACMSDCIRKMTERIKN